MEQIIREDGAQSKRLIAVESLRACRQSKPKLLQFIEAPGAKCSAANFRSLRCFEILCCADEVICEADSRRKENLEKVKNKLTRD